MSTLILKEFQDDPIYSPFFEDDFDVQSHTSQLVQGVIIAEHLNKLNIGISRLEKEIEHQVGTHYEDLLSQATGVETLEDILSTMHARIQTLLAGVERVRARIVEPYNKLEKHTLMLGRLQASCELLRRIIRCLMLSQRLQVQLSNGPRDITKAASSLSELDHLGKDVNLTGIDILEKDQKLIRQARSDVEKQATSMMERGMANQNQTQVGTALQVFHNLGILSTSVEKVLEGLITRLNDGVASALDVNALSQNQHVSGKKSGPGKALMPSPGHSAQFRASLWASLEKLMDEIYQVCVKTSHLHKVLSKKRDPVTHICFLDAVQSQDDLFTRVWRNITSILTEEFSKSAQNSTYIRQALEVDYPKLVRLYGDLWRRLEGISLEMRVGTSNYQNDDDPLTEKKHPDFDPEQALRDTLVPLEKAYLSRSLSRLFDPVNLMFSSSETAPDKQELDTLMRTITSELNVSAVDKHLNRTVAKNIVKTIQLFCSKCEHIIVTNGDATQVIGPTTSAQTLNVGVINQLMYVRTQIDRTASATLAHLPENVTDTLLTCIPIIDNLMSASVQPLFSSIKDTIEAIILTMHNEDFSGNNSPEGQCSLYMKELQNFIIRATNDYINPFTKSECIKLQIQDVASSCLDMFVRHASLLRPIGEGGKLRLAEDFAQMELAINPLCPRPSDLGRPYRIVRSFRPLLFQTLEHVAAAPSIGDVIPYSTILHFLFARAPPQLKSPHQTAGWSVGRYSTWLDQHRNERERLQLVKGALESYVASVKTSNMTQFAPVYPIMVQLLERGFAYIGMVTSTS